VFKLSVNKDLFSKILSKKLYVIEKESSNYWKKELLEPIIIENKLTYKIKKINKLLITNGLGEDKPQIVIECLKIDFLQQKSIFEFYLGKILEQKNYKFEKRSGIGRTEMIVIDENGNATAVADSRGDDSVAIE